MYISHSVYFYTVISCEHIEAKPRGRILAGRHMAWGEVPWKINFHETLLKEGPYLYGPTHELSPKTSPGKDNKRRWSDGDYKPRPLPGEIAYKPNICQNLGRTPPVPGRKRGRTRKVDSGLNVVPIHRESRDPLPRGRNAVEDLKSLCILVVWAMWNWSPDNLSHHFLLGRPKWGATHPPPILPYISSRPLPRPRRTQRISTSAHI